MFNNTVFKWFWTIFSLGAPAFLCKSLIYWFRTTRFISTPKRHAIVSVLLKQAARNVGDTCFYRCEKQTFLRENIVLFCDCNKFILKKSHNPLSKSTIVYYLLRIKRAVILENKNMWPFHREETVRKKKGVHQAGIHCILKIALC